MGLQRWQCPYSDRWPIDDGEYVLWADVDALLARIRAAVAAERRATRDAYAVNPPDGYEDTFYDARIALDALLADGDA